MSKITRKLPVLSARLFLGLIFTVFGLNGFLGFLPAPELPAPAAAFAGALAATGYMFPLIKGTEVLVGLALLSGRAVPLALTVLAPITINILLLHTLLAPALTFPLAILAAHLYLAWAYRDSFRGVLNVAAKPAEAVEAEPALVRRPA
jgi:uncharacterized membrane protein YphA (DoxX/SURF4 family)